MTILQIKQDNNDNIRIKVLPSSILKTEDADMRDDVADELRDRGVLSAADTAGLAAVSHDNTRLVYVPGVGLFVSLETVAAADNETTFDSADAGWLWKLVLAVDPTRDRFEINSDDFYDLENGFMCYEIWILPSVTEAVKIGITEGGDEIMLEEELQADQWKSVRASIFTPAPVAATDQRIYFTGFTDTATIIIHKKRI